MAYAIDSTDATARGHVEGVFPVDCLRVSPCEQRGQALSYHAVLDEDVLTTQRMVNPPLVASQPAERVVSIGHHQACSFSIRDVILKAESTGASAPLCWQG